MLAAEFVHVGIAPLGAPEGEVVVEERLEEDEQNWQEAEEGMHLVEEGKLGEALAIVASWEHAAQVEGGQNVDVWAWAPSIPMFSCLPDSFVCHGQSSWLNPVRTS